MDTLTLATAFKMTVALGFVLIVFGAAIWVAKKFTGGKVNLFNRGNKPNVKPLEILAYQNLGPGKNIYIVRCYNQKVLIGATGTNITQLAQLSTEEESLDDDLNFDKQLNEKTNDEVEQSTKSRFGSFVRDLSRV